MKYKLIGQIIKILRAKKIYTKCNLFLMIWFINIFLMNTSAL